MRCTRSLQTLSLTLLALSTVFGLSTARTQAQSALTALHTPVQANRISAHPDFGPQTGLTGHIPQWVTEGNQVRSRAVDLSAPLHVSIVLRRDPTVQAAFTQFLADQQNPGSPVYHQWLTPQQVGTFFGPTSSDLATVTSWLASQGLTVQSISPSHVILEVSGSTSAIGSAFRTSFGYFMLDGAPRLSAISEPFVPTALAPVINSISGLTEIPLKPMSYHSTPQQKPVASSTGTPIAKPLFTNTNNGSTAYFLVPNDYATIYDINSVYNGGNTGATIGTKAGHVAIIGRSRVAATDISEWATNVALASYHLNTIIPTTGTDPGTVCTFANAATCATGSDQGEQTLDVDRVIGTAPGVQADLVVSLSSKTYDGIYIAASYNVNTLVDPIMTISYGACETSAGTSGVTLWDTLFSTGAAEGISTFVSSGDSGANACAAAFTPTKTPETASINYICSSSYDTCVGGTEFNDNPATTYWAATNGTGLESAKSYIPEGGWNESNGGTGAYEPAASGGGPSLIIAKPSWQTGTGVPADGHRDTPDVSYPAADHTGVYACLDFELGLYTSQNITAADTCAASGGGYFFGFSGTSAAAPTMAGVTALLNTKLAAAQGNLNPLLYKIAAGTSGSAAFHDVTLASSGVTGCVVTTPSMCNNSTPGETSNSTAIAGGVQGYLIGTGYDEVTGLGSMDVANLLTAASAVATSPSFTVTPATTSFTLAAGATTGNTDTISVASTNSFAGAVALTCTVTNTSGTAAGTCTLSPTSTTLTSGSTGTSTLTISPTTGTSGAFTVTVTGTSGSTVVTSSIITVTVTAPATPGITLSAPAALSFTSGATSGNSTTSTLTSVNGFTGAVTLSCAITASTAAAYFPPTCLVTPTPATLTSGGTSTETITIGSTVAQAKPSAPQQAGLTHWGIEAGVFLAAMLCLVPFRRRRVLRPLAAFALLALGLTALSGCSKNAPATTSTPTTPKSSAGSYIVTVSASGTSVSTTTTFNLTIN
jgi:pseudomonalisin